MPVITVGQGATIDLDGVQFPLKPGASFEVPLADGAGSVAGLLPLLDLSDEQRRLLELGAQLFAGGGVATARRPKREDASAPTTRARRNGGRRASAPRDTRDPWSGEKVYSPGFNHLSETTRALTGVEKDRAKAKTLGEALRAARAKDAAATTDLLDRWTERLRVADVAEKKRLLSEVLRELKAV